GVHPRARRGYARGQGVVLAEGLRALVLNAGSSTLKWSVLEGDSGAVVASGTEAWVGGRGEHVRELLRALPAFAAAGHRVVHGGGAFGGGGWGGAAGGGGGGRRLRRATPRRCAGAPQSAAALDTRAGAAGAEQAFAGAPKVAAFDTAFHAGMPEAAAGYALPREWSDRWRLRRYGFHGLSVAYSVARVAALAGAMPARLIVCHLGGGFSGHPVVPGRAVAPHMSMTSLIR